MTEVKITAARQEQSKADKKSMLDLLRGKPRKSRELVVSIGDETVTMKFAAISAIQLDKLRSAHPPTKEQRANGAGVNTRTFAPALVAATLVEPAMTEDEARELWDSDFWSSGELDQLFETASSVCLEGMDIPRNASV